MRFVWTLILFPLLLLGACSTKSENFQSEFPPVDTVIIHTYLDALFSYCAGVSEDCPVLPLLDSPAAMPERIYALADTVHTQLTGLQNDFDHVCFGENNRGYLELRECAASLDAKQKNEAQKALASVNKERKALYYELALYHHHSDLPISEMEEIAADTYFTHAKSGEWVQAPPSGKRFEKFLESPLGSSLGDRACAGGWIQIP